MFQLEVVLQGFGLSGSGTLDPGELAFVDPVRYSIGLLLGESGHTLLTRSRRPLSNLSNGPTDGPSYAMHPGFRTVPDRVWRNDLTEVEIEERQRLEDARINDGLTPTNRTAYDALTRPQAAERPRLSELPDDLLQAAHKRLKTRKQRARGELPTTRRVSSTDRRRVPTFERASFKNQLGRLADERDEAVIAMLVRELRRQAKDLGYLPPEHDRRRRRGASDPPTAARRDAHRGARRG